MFNYYYFTQCFLNLFQELRSRSNLQIRGEWNKTIGHSQRPNDFSNFDNVLEAVDADQTFEFFVNFTKPRLEALEGTLSAFGLSQTAFFTKDTKLQSLKYCTPGDRARRSGDKIHFHPGHREQTIKERSRRL